MDRNKELADRRMQMAMEATARWQQHTSEREELQRKLSIGGPRLANTSERLSLYRERETARATREGAADIVRVVEAQIGTWDATKLAPDEQARTAGKPVARLVTMPDGRFVAQGFATGFLVSDRLLLTNHHVFASAAEAAGTGANFHYETTSQGVQKGILFELDPDTFFLTYPTLDLSLVAVKPTARSGETLTSLGRIPLIATLGKILVGQPMNIIGYPAGGVKQYATQQNKVTEILDEGFLHYTTDTLPGNSGSAGYNQDWELVALHHAGIPQLKNGKVWSKYDKPYDKRTMNEEDIVWVANEGARTSAIVTYLSSLRMDSAERTALLKAALAATGDPLRPERTGVSAPPFVNPATPSPLDINATAMAQYIFNLNGPVTIQFNHLPAPVPAAPPLPPPSPVDMEAAIRFDQRYGSRKGYDPNFLDGFEVPAPTVTDKRAAELVKDDDGRKPLLLKYHHFSLVMNERRRLQMWSAVNVDYSAGMKGGGRNSFGKDHWIADPRLPVDLQITDDDFYGPATKVDRGHIVRREDNAWGATPLEREYANSDTFHWTNCTPQHEAFNRSNESGLWGAFENAVTDQIGAVGDRACIFAGPVLDPKDPDHDFGTGSIQYPLRFWKVVIAVSDDTGEPQLRAYGFLFDQKRVVEDQGLEEMDFRNFGEYQVSLQTIADLTGVSFAAKLHAADVLKGARHNERVRVESMADITHARVKHAHATNGKSKMPA